MEHCRARPAVIRRIGVICACACRGYDRAAFKLRGEGASLNYPDTDYAEDWFYKVSTAQARSTLPKQGKAEHRLVAAL